MNALLTSVVTRGLSRPGAKWTPRTGWNDDPIFAIGDRVTVPVGTSTSAGTVDAVDPWTGLFWVRVALDAPFTGTLTLHPKYAKGN